MIGKPVLHPPNPAMIVIEGARVSLPCATVVDDDELPARALHGCAPDRVDRRAGEIFVSGLARPRPETRSRRRGRRRFETLFLFQAGLFNGDVGGRRHSRLRRGRGGAGGGGRCVLRFGGGGLWFFFP